MRHPLRKFSRSPAGLTLIELIVTLVILGILLTIAIPLMRPLVRSTNLTSSANSFVAALNYARSEAVTRGARVVACASSNPMANPPACSNNANWQTGWLVFLDSNENNTYQAANDTLLRVAGPIGGDLTLAGANPAVAFTNLGAAIAGSGNYIVCGSGLNRWTVNVTASGRINNQRGAVCP
ncbi:GspH/FimT family pseudopilin [Desulfuromonas sp. CSMB_57]|uniref:GspH/FimT family pseudopilin n=1 Tax=Desulfuromonas sp. CSMB_57 TaxID=2807629 RepID=UPI001CD359FF|nr:GspH/FimT family pseudopilin [Desulfuromonas sp. CSMB_57]